MHHFITEMCTRACADFWYKMVHYGICSTIEKTFIIHTKDEPVRKYIFDHNKAEQANSFEIHFMSVQNLFATWYFMRFFREKKGKKIASPPEKLLVHVSACRTAEECATLDELKQYITLSQISLSSCSTASYFLFRDKLQRPTANKLLLHPYVSKKPTRVMSMQHRYSPSAQWPIDNKHFPFYWPTGVHSNKTA